jgi:hypothetical protein
METFFDENAPTYVTIFENKSDARWPIEEKGSLLFFVEPGDALKLESWHERTDWARWAKVVRGKDLRLTVTENPAWVNPWAEFHCLELFNVDGSEGGESIQVRTPNPVSDGYVTAVRGVPRLVPLNLWDPLCRWSKITWKMKDVRVPIEGTRYYQTAKRLIKDFTPRSKSELKAILRERQAIEKARMDEETDKVLKAQEDLLLGDEK